MKPHILKEKSNIIIQYSIEDRTITIFNYPSTPDLYGISIVNAKYSHIEKYTTWDCILLKKDDLIKVCNYMKDSKNYSNPLYVKCTCFSEVLEVSELDKEVYLSLWDNYFSRYNKKIFKSEIWFSYNDAKGFANDILAKIS